MKKSFGNKIIDEITDNSTKQPIVNLKNLPKLQQKIKKQQQNVKNKLLFSMKMMRLKNLGSKLVIT